MRHPRLLTVATLIPVVVICVYVYGGPQIDPTKVVTLDDLLHMAMPCLHYGFADHRGWPIWRDERTYIRYLQDNGVRVAFIRSDDGSYYSTLIGFIDSIRIRQLHQQAKEAGLNVPTSAFGARIGG